MNLFYLFFFFIIFIDNLPIRNTNQVTFLLVLLTPLILFAFDFYKQIKIKIPKILIILQSFFLIFFIGANIFTKGNIYYALGLYVGSFLISIYVYNHKKEIMKNFNQQLILVSIVFILMYLFKNILLKIFPQIVVLNNQHLISYDSFTHNHLGDFLVLPLILLIKNINKKSKWIKVFLFAAIFMVYIFSFSRSAYLSFILSLILMSYFNQNKPSLYRSKNTFISIVLSLFLLIFIPFFIRTYSANRLNKTVFGNRETYFVRVFYGFTKNPLFGLGSGNYYKLNEGYKKNQVGGSVSSHNIFLDILAENGIFVFGAFLSLIGYGLFYGKKTVYYYLFFALLVNFQTDFTYKFIPIFWLFFILLGLIWQDREEINI